MTNSKKVVVKYFGEDYLVDGGCKAKDETVLKYLSCFWNIDGKKNYLGGINFAPFFMQIQHCVSQTLLVKFQNS